MVECGQALRAEVLAKVRCDAPNRDQICRQPRQGNSLDGSSIQTVGPDRGVQMARTSDGEWSDDQAQGDKKEEQRAESPGGAGVVDVKVATLAEVELTRPRGERDGVDDRRDRGPGCRDGYARGNVAPGLGMDAPAKGCYLATAAVEPAERARPLLARIKAQQAGASSAQPEDSAGLPRQRGDGSTAQERGVFAGGDQVVGIGEDVTQAVIGADLGAACAIGDEGIDTAVRQSLLDAPGGLIEADPADARRGRSDPKCTRLPPDQGRYDAADWWER